MTQKCFALDDVDYLAKDLRMWHIGRTSGVIGATGKDFKAKATSGMTLTIDEGYAYLQCGTQERGGVVFGNTGVESFTLAPSDSLRDRYDAIVIRYSRTENTCSLVLVQGMLFSIPPKYKPVRDANTFELVLKYIKVNHGISAINDSMIEDAILDEKVCGMAVDTLAKIPTDQYEAQIDSFIKENERSFLVWFNTIKDKLDGNTAGKLQNEIDTLENSQTATSLIVQSHTEEIAKLNEKITYGVGTPEGGKDGDVYIQYEG